MQELCILPNNETYVLAAQLDQQSRETVTDWWECDQTEADLTLSHNSLVTSYGMGEKGKSGKGGTVVRHVW